MPEKNNGGAHASGKLDLNAVWTRGLELLIENWQLIAVIAGVFVLVPGAALQFTLPADSDLEGPLNVLIDINASQIAQERAARALGRMIGPFLMAAAVSVVIAHVGYAAIVALIGRQRPTVGEALALAVRVILPLVLAMIITLVALYAVLFVVQLVLMPLGTGVAAFIGSIISVLVTFFVTARLYLTLPAMVVEWRLNPLSALTRSWKLTSKASGNVFGFWMLLAVAWFVTLLIQSVISFALAAIPGPGPTASLIAGLMNGFFAMVWGSIYCAMSVAMHAILVGPEPTDIAAEFE